MVEQRLHLARHQMVWVEPDAWSEMLAARGAPNEDALIQGWAESGWPLIARSRNCEDRDDLLALGIPLPPSNGKGRHAFRLGAQAVSHTEKPPLLAHAAAAAPPPWLHSISSLLLLDPHTRCFGSLAWEFLTGLPYVTSGSDLDLLWFVGSPDEADRLASAIASIDHDAFVSLDGELITPDGGGIQWREWHANEPVVLVKMPGGPQLLPRDRIFA
ncbi:malonate decarboxylase holo-[acyl-carrier-protein] synthase [Sphingomonas sp. M1-B02]|uniref:malonate decarboxylase holo-[acyl-carrier-protein] synthase n=1 Tax=Sphingomonas sp. M1-B02 TaxID=3114300 RepID=UPI00223EE2AF|nr:malonate decarboxylase holo-[acyl-carrier-protein] synthase [Sphingomonas sp. S6-11]UZK66303.1 malonate decarboxylase holo-[acyl-carrier-protein] synthase [Sphingomonas sp. S6-11]